MVRWLDSLSVLTDIHSSYVMDNGRVQEYTIFLHFEKNFAHARAKCTRLSFLSGCDRKRRTPRAQDNLRIVPIHTLRITYIYRTTSDKVRMRQMFHVKHGVDAPPTTCMRSPKRKRLRNRCFAKATDINGCSVARSIEVTMVGTARSIEITKVSYHAWWLKFGVY